MNKYTTVTVSAKQYEDQDDCLTAAAREYAREHKLEMWEVEAAWPTDRDGREDRSEIALTVPVTAAAVSYEVREPGCAAWREEIATLDAGRVALAEARDSGLCAALYAVTPDDERHQIEA